MLKIYRFGLQCAIWFSFAQIVGRFLYPFGDEPDFTVRAPNLIFGEFFFLSPYEWWSNFMSQLKVDSYCAVSATPFSFWAAIDSRSCTESVEQISVRLLVTLTVVLPILFFIISANNISAPRWSIANYENGRGDALAISILIPGVAYSLGVLAEEQLVLALSLLLVIFDRRFFLTLGLVLTIFLIDFGNGIVVLTLVLSINFYRWVLRKFSIRIALLTALAQTLVALLSGIAFVGLLANFTPLADKASAIYSAVSESDLVGKYPIYLRPAITFMTAVFTTPAFVKSVPAFLVIGLFFLLALKRIFGVYRNLASMPSGSLDSYSKDKAERLVDFVATVSTILLFIFLIPTYSNAKYYLFAAPFLVRAALAVTSKRKIAGILILTQTLIFINLALYRA